ncbi:hypothetical protein KP509_02G098900 [Ceratopteris richardii]|uniref:RING-type E3 ubiquitin transferase n=1 Tax=Ceratopteris richardii TaxID=49495 RepID=A0A8T2VC61_CERRI|nr:hypothetical protein KP509_02G098900 [Ceratopteris richardii]
MVHLLAVLILLQVIRPLPGPDSSSDVRLSPSPPSAPSVGGSNNNSTFPNTTSTGNSSGPFIPTTAPGGPLPDSFRPNIGVIIGVVSTMFSLSLLFLLYAKHCARPPPNRFGTSLEHVISPPPALAHSIGPATFFFADRESGLDYAVIEALPLFSFSALKGMKEGLECAVCLSKYEFLDTLRLLPKCRHAFHLDCVDEWLRRHSTCPLCRVRIDAEDTLILEDLSGLSRLGYTTGEPVSRRQSARVSLSELGDNHLDRAFELYVQRDIESGDASAMGGSLRHGSSRSSWRRMDISSERKLGSWRSSVNGASDRKSENGSARVAPLQIVEEMELETMQRSKEDDDHGGISGGRGNTPTATMPICPGATVIKEEDYCLHIDEDLARRIRHRIIVSDVVIQHRWSDFLPSDVPYFDAGSVQLREPSPLPVPHSNLNIQGDTNDGEAGVEPSAEHIAEARGRRSWSTTTDDALGERRFLRRAESGKKKNDRKAGESANRLRCESELSGLQRIKGKQNTLAEGGGQTRGYGATDFTENEHCIAGHTSSMSANQRWMGTARRTLTWLIGRSTPN